MTSWPLKTVDDCASPEPYATQIGPFGKALMADEYTATGVPVLRGVNLTQGRFHDDDFVFVSEQTADRFTRFESHPGDVLLVHKGTVGQVGLMPERRRYQRYIMGNSMLRVRCDPGKLLPEFLYYWFRSSYGQHYLSSRLSTVGVPQLQRPLTSLREATLAVPPLPEQKRIAHILGTLDDKIELNRRMCRTLEEMARAIFKSWFVDFDPVRAKAEGRAPHGMDAATAALFPDSFIDSELGPIPKGWDVKRLDAVFEINPSRPLLTAGEAPYVDMQNVPTSGHCVLGTRPRIPGSGSRFANGDTLLARITPCLENGKTAYVDFLQDGQVAWGSTEFIVLRPKSPLPSVAAYLMARDESFREFAIQSMTGSSGRQRVPTAALADFRITVPAAPLAGIFGEVAMPLFARARSATRENVALAAQRNALLPRLLGGGLRSRDFSSRRVGR